VTLPTTLHPAEPLALVGEAPQAGVPTDSLAPATSLPNPALIYHDAKAKGSRPAVRAVLNRIAGWLLGKDRPTDWGDTCRLPWWEIRARHVHAIRSRLMEVSAPRTVNRDLSLLRSVMTIAWENEQIPTDAYHHAKHVKGVDKDKTKAGRALEVSELHALVGAGEAWETPDGPRALAVLALMYAGGLRRAEVAGALRENFDPSGSKIALVGKRGKRRIAYLQSGWGKHVQRWAEIRHSSPRLIGVKSPESIGRILEELRVRARVAPFTAHDLRRSFGTHLLASGKDLSLVRDLMGHDDIQTTMLYDRRGEEEMREAVEDLPGPHPD
jgi:site-specific recombinase XerD